MGRYRRWVVVLVSVIALLGWPAPAAAHPLGNFTVNHYTRIEIYGDRLRVRYVLDMAEIPAFPVLRALDGDGDGQPDERAAARYQQEAIERLRQGLRLEVDGQPAALRLTDSALSFPAGQAGLNTLRLSGWFEAPVAAEQGAPRDVRFTNANPGERPGWNEIVVWPAPGIRLEHSTAPAHDQSDELRAYPEALLDSPLDERSAHFSFEVVTAQAAAPPLAAAEAPAGRAPDGLVQLIERESQNPLVAAVALAVAAAYGGLHALTPGHGKALVGAYLVGARGNARHALLLGLTVTATHTLGVYALGAASLLAAEYVLPERLYPILGAVSGGLVVVIGGRLFLTRLAEARHGHGHDHEHGHAHPPGPGVPVRQLLALGISGGLVPCPSALLLMLGALALNRVAFGLWLTAAFSAGLALVLTTIGLLLVSTGRLLARLRLFEGRARPVLAVSAAGALVMTLAGAAALLHALQQMGL
jgi:ABC-type nickel/cobalt efflux system permease component RcnA